MLPHTIRLPPPFRSCSTMAQFAYLSPLRRQMRRRLSSISSRNRDSLVKSTVAHCWSVHRRCCLSMLAWLVYVSGKVAPQRKVAKLCPALWSWFPTVWTDILVPVSAEQLREHFSRTGTRVSVQTVGINFTANYSIVEHDRYGGGSLMVPRSAAGWQSKTSSGEDSTAVPASSLCGLHRCNRWTYAIWTDLWGFIGDPSDLPYKFSHSHLVLQTPTDGFLSVNEMM